MDGMLKLVFQATKCSKSNELIFFCTFGSENVKMLKFEKIFFIDVYLIYQPCGITRLDLCLEQKIQSSGKKTGSV